LDDNLIEVKGLKKYFPVRKGLLGKSEDALRAVDDVSFSIRKGETLGLVGESGSGKTTVGQTVLRLVEPTGGEIWFRSRSAGEEQKIDLAKLSGKQLKSVRREMQIIFQDPYSSLDPRMNVGSIVGEPLFLNTSMRRRERLDRVRELLQEVGLKPEHLNRYPHEFSGGQRQRIGISRALALEPQLIIADEPVSALDVSVQAQIINLLENLQKRLGLTYLFITHDLSVVKHLCTRVAVMYLGKIVESGENDAVFEDPKHPYTEALISAVPVQDPDLRRKRILLRGDIPSPIDPPPGCAFHTRCHYAQQICKEKPPASRDLGGDHAVACHLAEELSLKPLSSNLP
jgi:oligopeptide/dipeptide ABC transporter ATP-binding protein